MSASAETRKEEHRGPEVQEASPGNSINARDAAATCNLHKGIYTVTIV